jgi:acetoin utilization protein AcuB
MRVRDWMTVDVATAKPRTSLAQARALLEAKRINQLPVVAHSELVGIITDRDLRDAFPSVFETSRQRRRLSPESDPERVTVDQVMSQLVLVVAPDETLENAARLMRRERLGALPVVDDGELVGILTRSDLLDAFVYLAELPAGSPDRPAWLSSGI